MLFAQAITRHAHRWSALFPGTNPRFSFNIIRRGWLQSDPKEPNLFRRGPLIGILCQIAAPTPLASTIIAPAGLEIPNSAL
jgi:hypothetical protein